MRACSRPMTGPVSRPIKPVSRPITAKNYGTENPLQKQKKKSPTFDEVHRNNPVHMKNFVKFETTYFNLNYITAIEVTKEKIKVWIENDGPREYKADSKGYRRIKRYLDNNKVY